MRLLSVVLGFALFGLPAGRAQELRFASGPERVSLIELFTSEGCSSCPPADRWLGALRGDRGLWHDYVPIAFHVNYWDNLGWKDRLSSSAFTARQYAHARDWGASSVYTPCFVRDGAEWHPEARAPTALGVSAGILEVKVDGDRCAVHWTPGAGGAAGEYDVHVAILGGGISSRVTAGENRGSTLTHEFVALGLADTPLESAPPGVRAAEFSLPPLLVSDPPRRALAAWVTLRRQLAPLQATGGWIDGGR